MENYTPISCDFYDWIEHFATKKQVVTIRFKDANNQEQTARCKILTTSTAPDGEYVYFNAGVPSIRLDHLIAIEDQLLANFQAC